ncbi:MAG: WYL domain-containing protein [Bacteroidales bacterium]|nr:WYL domain-containing protein [Bacteroidales bacterium]
MATNKFGRYIWLIDTIRRYGAISRRRLNELWKASPYSNGSEMPRRTFYNYRNAVEEIFNINIECNSATHEYYIADQGDSQKESVTDWMLYSSAMSEALSNARAISHRIFLEDVPSAREHLSQVITAMHGLNRLRFTYLPYTRSNPTRDVVLEPYFLKIFRQRWYITGRNVSDEKIKTYALDRMSDVEIDTQTFVIPPDFDPLVYSRDAFGIVFDQGTVEDVKIRVGRSQAKYFYDLPLHHSQKVEEVDDESTVFSYHVRLTGDFVEALLSYGPRITVLSPPVLVAMMKDNLQKTLKNYK